MCIYRFPNFGTNGWDVNCVFLPATSKATASKQQRGTLTCFMNFPTKCLKHEHKRFETHKNLHDSAMKKKKKKRHSSKLIKCSCDLSNFLYSSSVVMLSQISSILSSIGCVAGASSIVSSKGVKEKLKNRLTNQTGS